MPEEPAVTLAEREAAAKKAAGKPAPAKAAPQEKSKPAAPVKAADTKPEPPASGSAMVQLGAFSSEGAAARAWTNLSQRFAYLAELDRVISPAKIGDGTVYRLRASARPAGNRSDEQTS